MSDETKNNDIKYPDDNHCEERERCPRIVAAAAAADIETLNSLIRSGADVNLTDDQGRTALIAAAAESYFAESPEQFKRYVSIIGVLLANGADAGIRDENGHTASDHAYLSNEIESILAGNDTGGKP